MVRRSTFDPFAKEQLPWPHRVLVTDKFGAGVLERPVPAWSNLREVFEQELQAWAAKGWTIEQPYKAACFINRGAERYLVTLSRDLAYRGGPVPQPRADVGLGTALQLRQDLRDDPRSS